jgi:hypothetical protein
MMEQYYVTFGTTKVDIGSERDKLWDKQGDFLGQEKLILSQTRQIMGQNKVTFGTGEVDIES